jgi:hypothetical protein
MGTVRLEERFWSKVDKGPDCWLWTASTFRSGRGEFRVGSRTRQAHLVAWELIYGSPPAGLLRGRCGNLRCVRPDHQMVTRQQRGMPRSLATPPEVRFWSKVDKGPDCWLWTGSIDHLGFSEFRLMMPGGAHRMLRAYRYAWKLAHGEVPAGVDVVHRCRTRQCVRPEHLALRVRAERPHRPTPRQIDVIRGSAQRSLRRGALNEVAAELGISLQAAGSNLWQMRTRLGVSDNREVITWLDGHQPGWRKG